MPSPEQFASSELYYSTRAHETIHWTGHSARINRLPAGGPFERAKYAKEELVAELGSAFICAQLGIENEARQDHVDYIHCWLDLLQRDTRAIFRAARAAQKAVGWLEENRHLPKNTGALAD